MKKEGKEKKIILLLLGCLVLAGFILRFGYCYRGYPYQLHPDEHTIVDSAIDMLKRHSWEAYVYNRPDQFEIKCNAFIFTIASWIKYHMPAYEAFELNKGAFYLLARFYTTIFGTAMIPMIYLTVGKILKSDRIAVKKVQLLAATLTAFSPIFIEHSAYATPDVVLSFFVLLMAYLSSVYLEKGRRTELFLIAAITGICISIKYPAAIMCLYIAFIVIYKCIKDKGFKKKECWKDIFICGVSAVLLILTVIFVIAPNLFTDFQSVVTTFIAEARPNHVGQDGLGFIGNLKFYLQTIGDSFGLISYLMFAAGIAFLAKNRRFEHFPLLLSVIYWICLSALALFWVRWGLPMFLSYIMITAIGGVWVCEQAELLKKRGKVFKIAMTVLLALVVVNTTVSGIKVTKWSAMEDTRIAAMEFCTENNITQENSVYEGYTPIAPDFGKGAQYVSFEMDGDKVKVKEEHKDKKYFVLSSSFKNRYINNAADYPEAAAIYGNLDNSYPLIYEISGESYRSSALEVKSIYYGLKYIFEKESLTGLPIYIYDLQPEINEADREA